MNAFAVLPTKAMPAAPSTFLPGRAALTVKKGPTSKAACLSAPKRSTTQAFFGGMFGGSSSGNTPMVCMDCGYIYRGDFRALPNSYECPKCGVGKNRFRAYDPNKQGSGYYGSLAAQKKKNREAMKKRNAKGDSARAKLRKQAMENMRAMDKNKRR
mmetsp:Transcript_12657/g.46256  ORF Transcript_12657/g.46256 Transcript_12657/m.46256 type:complete len:156 (+) Transcript_12657:54-521(+)